MQLIHPINPFNISCIYGTQIIYIGLDDGYIMVIMIDRFRLLWCHLSIYTLSSFLIDIPLYHLGAPLADDSFTHLLHIY